MNNGNIPKVQEGNSKRVLDTKDKTDEGKICKQATQNSSSTQNKFDLPSFKCKVCPYESIWKHAVKRHQQTHYRERHNPEENKKSKYKCESCSYTTNNWTILNDHQKLLGCLNKKVETQNKDLPTLDAVELRGKQIEESEIKRKPKLHNIDIYSCKQCNYKTMARGSFESHKKVHLLNREESFRCNLCSFNSVYRQSFLRHMKTMHENDLNKEENGLYMHEGMEEKLDHIDKNIISSVQQKAGLNLNGDQNVQSHNNNLTHQVKSRETMFDSFDNKPSTYPDSTFRRIDAQKCVARTRRGKYSNVPVKTTKNGLFECEHCSYQTAIRTALVKHQTNHLKHVN